MNRRGHGIHSPFVFDLVCRVFGNKPDPEVVSLSETIRKRLRGDKRIIDVHRLGAGASGNGKRSATVSEIAAKSSVTSKYGRFLANMSSEFGKHLVVELGTAAGISTIYLAAANRDARVITMEGNRALAQIAAENFKNAGVDNVLVLEGPFSENIVKVKQAGMVPGLIFIDGDHRKGPLLEYFDQLLKISDSQTVLIFDDINYSEEMNEAWEIIRNNENVALSVDIYRMGILFLRKGMTRNNYVIIY